MTLVDPILGGRVRVDEFDPWRTAINELISPTETSYTVAWTASGTAPALGNGTRTGRYWRASSGLWVDGEAELVLGSTSTLGTGVWFFSAPVAAAASQVGFNVGWAYALDTNPATAEFGGLVKLETTTKFRILPAVNVADDETNWGPTQPIAAPNSGDTYRIKFRYRAA